MNRLDKLSYYLSYTHFVPFVSIPAGIVQIICAIRDRALNPQVYPVPKNESFRAFTDRKLDNWSLLAKGILAIIPGIGNAILFKKWIDRRMARRDLFSYMNNHDPTHLTCVPNYLFHDREFLKMAREQLGANSVEFFRKTSNANKNDKIFIRELIAENKIDYRSLRDFSPALQADNDIINDLIGETHRYSIIDFFITLPADKQNTPAIAHAVFAKARLSSHVNIADFLNCIVDKNILNGPGASEDLTRQALLHGNLRFKELSDKQKQNENFALAALRCDFDRVEEVNWLDFPEDLQDNRILLNNFVKEIASVPRSDWYAIIQTPWFVKWGAVHGHSRGLDRHEAKALAERFLGNSKDVIISK
jgi:hypothetical protein